MNAITDNLNDICDRLLQSTDPKEIAKTLRALPDVSKAAFAGMHIAAELSLTATGYKLLGRIQTELLKEK